MSWTYRQSSGCMFEPDGTFFDLGYAGHGPGVNNPGLENVHLIGPLPKGRYQMVAISDSDHTGLASIILVQHEGLDFGRSGFRIHGDNAAQNHSASEGCIVISHAAGRQKIWYSSDHDLIVEA